MAEKIMNVQDLAQQVAKDGTIITTASKTTLWGYMSSVLGFLADNGVAVAVGTIVAIAGFIVNFYFQRRRNKRENDIKNANEQREIERHEWLKIEHQLKVELLQRGINPDIIEPERKIAV